MTSPWVQLICGLVCLSHGRPRITCSCPISATRNLVPMDLLPVFSGMVTLWVMVDPMMGVPSMFLARMGHVRGVMGRFHRCTRFLLIKVPSAPESMSALVWMSFPCSFKRVGICIDCWLFDCTHTHLRLRVRGDPCICLDLPFRNPVHHPPHRACLLRLWIVVQ